MRMLAATVMALGLLAAPDVAFACDCADTRPRTADGYKRWLQDYPGVVFRGTVTSVTPGPTVVVVPDLPPERTWTVTFAVDRQWKGVRSREFIVTTPFDDGVCGVRFQQRVRYLVGADMQRGMLHVSLCSSGWINTQDEAAFLAALGQGSPPPAR